MKLIIRHVKELEESQYKACHGLNHGAGGLMQGKLESCHDGNTEAYAVMLFHEDKLLSWALVFAYDLDHEMWGAYFFTEWTRRHLGYGDKVAEEVKRNFRRVMTWPSDQRGENFFKKHGFKIDYRWMK